MPAGPGGGKGVDTTTTEQGEKGAAPELEALLQRAEKGDVAVLPELRKALDADADLWRHYGDLALQAEASLIKLAAGVNLLLAESLQRSLKALKDELCGGSVSPLERLLVERVTATWLQTAYADGLAAQPAGGGEARLKAIQRLQDAASRRHLAALKTLATIRKLLTPAVSPLQIASRMGGKEPPTRMRVMTPAEGVPVAN
jgi:hypothetical protein